MNQNDLFHISSFLYASNAPVVSRTYEEYKINPSSVDQDWKYVFDNISKDDLEKFFNEQKKLSYKDSNIEKPEEARKKDIMVDSSELIKAKMQNLESLYIRHGHISADLDPIFSKVNQKHCDIINALNDVNKIKNESVQQEILNLDSLYCGNVCLEVSHITNSDEQNWIISRYKDLMSSDLNQDIQKKILKTLSESEAFESFIDARFKGMKRFSIEGSESAIVSVNTIIEKSLEHGVFDVVIGMAHRGRLNILANIVKKPFKFIFAEFLKKKTVDADYSGDVKYHAGYSSDIKIGNQKVHLSLCYNPSHLEAINPVAMGKSRANQDKRADTSGRQSSMCLLIHGDAAVMGQGVVTECLNMSNTKGYGVGGVIHVIINNQVGFTANPNESRGTRYASDVAKMIEAPIFHINGSDPEACYKMSVLAMEYRAKFKKDVFLDIVGYRKYGHNEGDEPAYTQPLMYEKIRSMKLPYQCYADQVKSFDATSWCDKILSEYGKLLQDAYDEATNSNPKMNTWLDGDWSSIKGEFSHKDVNTGISESNAINLLESIYKMPDGFNVNPKLEKQISAKLDGIKNTKQLDWASAEALAFASLLKDGNNVRITGQDAERGTFSHRHSILTDYRTDAKYNIFSNIKNGSYEVHNSVLSEYAVLGFEYGYAMSNPNTLTIWEAQFGDFANGASTIFDQFISSAQDKWLRLSGLVMLLPHGYDGQGPEHSSARLERHLQSCAKDNMIVANCTTPANLFHILRRQIKAEYRKPLIIMSPKSMLRHKMVVSNISEFTEDKNFLPIINDNIKGAKKIIFTSGKLYYDLHQYRIDNNISDVAIIRVEQYYPFHCEMMINVLKQHKDAKSFIWAQEEPKNMGAWSFIRDYLNECIDEVYNLQSIKYVGRDASATTATGLEKDHNYEQEIVIKSCFL